MMTQSKKLLIIFALTLAMGFSADLLQIDSVQSGSATLTCSYSTDNNILVGVQDGNQAHLYKVEAGLDSVLMDQ